MPFVTNASVADGGNGNASDMDDFIRNKLATFITSTNHFSMGDEWTRSQADAGSGSEFEVFLAPPTNFGTEDVDEPPYACFHTKDDGVFGFPGNGYDAMTPAYDQPGGPGAFPRASAGAPQWTSNADGSSLNPQQQCPSITQVSNTTWSQHHLFAPVDGRYCHAAMETETRVWRHFWFGNMIKFGGDLAWDGGQYMAGCRWHRGTNDIDKPYDNAHNGPFCSRNQQSFNMEMNSVFRCDNIEGALIWWTTHEIGGSLTASTTATRPSGGSYSNVNQASGVQTLGGGFANGRGDTLGHLLFGVNGSLISNAKPLIPIYVGIARTIDGAIRFCPIGQIPDVFRVNMKGFAPADEITIGSDTYTLIPLINSDVVNTVADDQYSGYEGFAYRQIP